MIEDALRARLLADPDVVAQVASRIWPVRLPQGPVFPAIVYQRVSTTGEGVAFETPVGPTRSRVQVSAWATTFGGARQLGEAVHHALHGWSGSSGGVSVQLVRSVNWLDDYEAGPPERFRVLADFYVFSMEGVAA
jgi:hypothetical protein